MGEERGSDVPAVTVYPGALDRRGGRGDAVQSGEFRVIGLLGKGGMGEVHAAEDRRLLRTVALKTLADGGSDPEARSRFCIEAQVGAQLEHPNIVPIYGIEETSNGALSFSMRMIAGKTYREYLSKCRAAEETGRAATGEYSLKTRLVHLAKICDALHYAHERGVVHRDVKPGNVLLGAHNELYLVDWGIARVQTAPEHDVFASINTVLRTRMDAVSVSDSGLTETGSVLGTPRYMAPEQAAGDVSEHGPETDQFLVGMMLHEAVTLRHPRRGTNAEVFRMAILGTRAPLVSYDGTKVDPRLRAIIERATAVKTSDRYPNISDLASDLRRFVRDEEVSVHPDGLGRRVWRRLSKRPGLALGAALAASLVVMGALAWSLTRTVAAERAAAVQAAARTGLTTQVMQRGDEVEAFLSRGRRVLARMVSVAEANAQAHTIDPAALSQGAALPDADPGEDAGADDDTPGGPPARAWPWFTERELAAGQGPETTFDPRYNQAVSWETASITFAAGEVDMAAAHARANSLGGLPEILRETVVRARDMTATRIPLAEQIALLRRSGPLLYAAVGYREGVLIDMPALTELGDTYDPRGRPWYRAGVGNDELEWMPPYADAASGRYLLPCYAAIHNAEGEVVGAAGGDMSMDELIAFLLVEVPGFRIGRLVDSEGLVIVDSREAGRRDERANQGDMRAVRHNEPVEDPALLEAIQNGEEGGLIDRGDALIVFDHFTEIDWTFAVWVDVEPYRFAP